MYVDPHEITRPQVEADAAARLLGLKPKDVLSAFTTQDTHFVYIARKASPKLASALARKNLPGFHFYGEERRLYPQGSLASHVLGYAGLDNRGLSGLELELDTTLAGRPGGETRTIDRLGHALDVVPASAGEGRILRRSTTRSRRTRSGAAADAREVAREGRDGRRARPEKRRRARDGERSGLRREPLRSTAPASRETAPSPTSTSRAPTSSSSRSPACCRIASSRRRRSSPFRTRSTSPTA